MSDPWASAFRYWPELRQITSLLGRSSLSAEEYGDVLSAVLNSWPREDRGDRGQEHGPGQVDPEEADVDVPEV